MTLCNTGGTSFRADSAYFDSGIGLNQQVTDPTIPLKQQESKDPKNVDKVRKHEYGKLVDMQEHDGHMAELWESVDNLQGKMLREGNAKS